MNKIQQKILKLREKKDLATLSLSEIALLVGAKSPQIIKYHMDKLRSLGYRLDYEVSNPFSEEDFELVSIPIVGSANCGPATIFADDKVEGHLKLSSKLLNTRGRNNLFAIRAKGTSMNRAKVHGEPINDGDFVIVTTKFDQPMQGDYIVAVVDGLANIKKYFIDPINNQVALISESSDDFLPIFLHESDNYNAIIAGKVIQVVVSPSR